MNTECCNVSILSNERYCSNCGWEARVNLSNTTRKGMLSTVKSMLSKLEDACQAQYNSIEYHQKHIEAAQKTLETLEAEYLNCKSLIELIESKMNAQT